MCVISLTFTSCEKNTAKDSEIIHFEDTPYNRELSNLSIAISNALKTNSQFRSIVKKEALVMFDGDYDILISNLKEKKVVQPASSLKSFDLNYTIKDLIEESYPENRKNSFKSSGSIIDELTEQYPELQISVPVNAEEWDTANYIPTVTFLPEEYEDQTTTVLTGYDSDGNVIEIDAVNEPDVPVIVVGLNERMERIPLPIPLVLPEIPTNLTGIKTESGIRLTWEMTAAATSQNTTGYYVYRKRTTESTYTLTATVAGVYNRSYDDNNIVANASYSYYVRAFNQTGESGVSNYVSVSAPAYPKPVNNFDAILQTESLVELRWGNPVDESISETIISRMILGETNGYLFWNSFELNASNSFDSNFIPEQKITYRIGNKSPIGPSEYKYDYVEIPYRDISSYSPVYIKQITFTDRRLERWPAGKPEFYIAVTNVDPSTKAAYTVQPQMEFRYDKDEYTSQIFYDKKVFDWKPGTWLDMLTFTAVEYDRSWGKLKFDINAGYNMKNLLKTGIDVGASAKYEIEFDDKGEKCGNGYLNYFVNPEIWIEFPNYGLEILVSETDE